MPNIPYPNVPNLPGVPPLPRAAYTVIAQVGANLRQSLSRPNSGVPPVNTANYPKWQILTETGTVVVTPDSVVEFEYRNQQRIPDYPVEKGAFSSYNKIATPYSVRVVLSCGGKLMPRSQFIKALDDALDSTNLYSLVTPDRIYKSASIIAVDYSRRSRSGVTLLLAEVFFQEVRQSGIGTIVTTKPDGAADTSNGQVSAVSATAQQDAAKGKVQ